MINAPFTDERLKELQEKYHELSKFMSNLSVVMTPIDKNNLRDTSMALRRLRILERVVAKENWYVEDEKEDEEVGFVTDTTYLTSLIPVVREEVDEGDGIWYCGGN